MAQWHCLIDGEQYGPVDEPTVREWVRTGRLKRSDYVWTSGMSDWATVDRTTFAPGASAAGPAPPPPASSFGYGPARSTYKPHRGGVILVLGILGLAVCWIAGIFAWVMGNNDLREMDAGVMDPEGYSMTRGGKICGIIGVFLQLGWFIIWLFVAGGMVLSEI